MFKGMIIGFISSDPVSKGNYTKFSVGFQSTQKNKDTGYYDTQFISCKAFNELGDRIFKQLKKGSQVFIEGTVDFYNYTDDNGVKKTLTSLIVNNYRFLQTNKSGDRPQQNSYNKPNNNTQTPKQRASIDDNNDEIPF